MPDTGQQYIKSRILLYLFVVALVVAALGEATSRFAGATAVTILEITVTAVLSAGLVLLYFQQTSILESQHELLEQELNREVRHQHTETLRERVRTWHGNPDSDQSPDPLDQNELRIPTVRGAVFSSAPSGSFTTASSDDEQFRVVPFMLENDRYLEDLLENHATDLRERKEEIERLHSEYVECRERFIESFDLASSYQTERYTLKPTNGLSRWIFKRLVLYERERFKDFDELREMMLGECKDGDSGWLEDRSRMVVRVEIRGSTDYAIYRFDRYRLN